MSKTLASLHIRKLKPNLSSCFLSIGCGCVQLNYSEKPNSNALQGWTVEKLLPLSTKFWTCNSTNSSTELPSTDLRASCDLG